MNVKRLKRFFPNFDFSSVELTRSLKKGLYSPSCEEEGGLLVNTDVSVHNDNSSKSNCTEALWPPSSVRLLCQQCEGGG